MSPIDDLHFYNTLKNLRYNLYTIKYIDFKCMMMNFSKYIPIYSQPQSKYTSFHHPRNFSHASFQASLPHLPPKGNHYSYFYYHRFILSSLEFHSNRIIWTFLCLLFIHLTYFWDSCMLSYLSVFHSFY